MAKSKRIKPVGDPLDYQNNHPEYEIRETRVSDYLRRYGTGHIEDLPQNTAPEITDDRTVDEMLSDEFVPHMSTETVDIMMEIEDNKERFEKAAQEIEMTDAARKKFDAAMAVINNPNSSLESKREAYSILDNLVADGYARARK